jgi:hypothetical protein
MTREKVGSPLVERLPADEVDRLSNAVIAQMEQSKPEIWFMFLYEQGLNLVLSRFVDTSPFVQSPICDAMEREILGLHPDLDIWKVGQISRAMQVKATDDLIAKYLEFRPPRAK